MLTIKETKELLKFVSDLGEGIAAATADKEWSLTDLVHFLPAAKSIFAGISGIDQVIDELYDLTEEEMDELKQYVQDEFNIEDDKTEEFVEQAMFIGFELWDFINTFFIKKD